MTGEDYKPSTLEAQAKGIVKPLDSEPLAYRLEIDEFVQNGPALNLFLLALEALQDNDIITKVKNAWKNKTIPQDRWLEKELANKEEYWWSYFAIASRFGKVQGLNPRADVRLCIHGLPKQPWIHKHYNNDDAYYCQHGKRVFPSWHRPYVFMIEQAIFNKMYHLAREFEDDPKAEDVPTRDQYISAARSFRLPYWDPWMPRNSVDMSRSSKDRTGLFGAPAILKTQEVFVRRPKNPGRLEQIDNPLYRYKVPRHRDLLNNATVGWTDFPKAADCMDEFTVRNPSGQATNRNNDLVLEYEMRTQDMGQTSKLWQLLVNMSTLEDGWETFSNHGVGADVSSEVSLESWHDDIHGMLGSGRGAAGNMGKVPVAAFDPIFWLHHNNVDRLFALYQALHPDRYVPEKAADGVDQSYPLRPFYKDVAGSKEPFWNSADARDWAKCGYAVPGTNSSVDPKALKANVEDYIKRTYFWISVNGGLPPDDLPFPKSMSSVEALIGVATKPPPPQANIIAVDARKGKPGLLKRQVPLEDGAHLSADKAIAPLKIEEHVDKKLFPKHVLEDGGQWTWNAHVTVDKYAFNGSYNINFFLGDPKDEESADFSLLKNQIGYSGVFANPADVECNNCKNFQVEGIRYGDVVPLSSELTKYLETSSINVGVPEELRTLQSLKREHVIPYLKKNLKWRITMPDGALKSANAVKDSGLEIRIKSSWYNLPTPENGLGSYEESVLHKEITQGKIGGYSE